MKSTSTPILHPTAATFEQEVLRSDLPVLVDFWAEWCPPCKMLKPELQKLAEDVAGRARIAFINVDEQPDLAGAFKINSIPALLIVKEGRVVDAWAGYAPRAAVLARLEKHLSKPASNPAGVP